MRRRARIASLLGTLLSLTVACDVTPLSDASIACPCAQGYVCINNLCVSADGAPQDAAPQDATTGDATSDGDAENTDATTGMDAAVTDAGVADAADSTMDSAMDSATDGSMDAGDSDARDGAPPISDLTCPAGLLCETFERQMPVGEISCANNTLGFDTADPAFGDASLLTSFVDGTGACDVTLPLSSAQTDAWLRFWVRRRGNLNYGTLGGFVGNRVIAAVALWDNRTVLRTQAHDAVSTTNYFPEDEWVCVEIHASLTGPDIIAELFTDGASRLLLTDTLMFDNDLPAVSFAWYEEETVSFSLAFDNVVVSRTRTPCGPR